MECLPDHLVSARLATVADRLSSLCPVLQADIRGVFAQVFCDFGPSFEVLDVDGEHLFLPAEQHHAWAAAGSDLACLGGAVA